MATLDEIFAREFRQTCQKREAITGAINLNAISVPPELSGVQRGFEKMTKVRLKGITDEYYSRLTDSDVFLWLRPHLMRRTFDCEGRFIRDTETNKYITKDVTLPNGCCAVISDKGIGVPLKYSSKEGFDYVDFVTVNGKRYFVYIVPKQYAYKMSELCLVLSFNRLRSFYSSMELKLMSGHTLYLSVVPYSPRRAENSNYRVLKVKASRDFSVEWQQLYNYWVSSGVLYPREMCELSMPVRDITNVAYRDLNPTLEEYQIYDYTKSLKDTGNDSFDIDDEGGLTSG